ncbi:hypothetical protein IWQ62_005318, partial [Dispira parvispora]
MSDQTNPPKVKPPNYQARGAEPEMEYHTDIPAVKSDLTTSTSYQPPVNSSETESEMTHSTDISDMDLDIQAPTAYQDLGGPLGSGSATTPNSDTVGVESDTSTSIPSSHDHSEPAQPPLVQ